MKPARPIRVGVDIGGTFTDIVLLHDSGDVLIKKISSSVENYAHAIATGLAEVFEGHELVPEEISTVMHATTVASNAILQRDGSQVGLIGTRGFRDVLEIRNLRMPRLYDLRWEKPPPLIERWRRITVDERINARGEVLRTLDRAEAGRAVDELLARGVESIAVCLINSYANPVHERLLGDVIAERAPGLPHCLSYDVLPEIKEYERTSTTVVNTYVLPIVERYLEALRGHLDAAGIHAPLLIMQSNGGLTPGEEAARRPVNIVESGPAAGVVGAQAIARASALKNLISFDMGGTTAKASLIEAGSYARTREYSVGGGIMVGSRLLTGGGYQISVPAIDLAEVGAGGGSIIWIDAGGALQAGPRSAGAVPGPVCYDIGGQDPTVTDANLILGYLNPNYLCGGELALNPARAREVFASHVAQPLELELAYAAYGARQVVISNMIRAIRAVSSERGRDPREFTLFAFGGNGGLFAADMASELGMHRIIVPPASGLFSAFGLLYAEVEHHYSRTLRVLLRAADPRGLESAYAALELNARNQLQSDGFDADHIELKRSANLHYQGQIYELAVALEPGAIDASSLRATQESFGLEHERTYGHRAGLDEPVELVNIEVLGRGLSESARLPATLRLRSATESVSTVGPERQRDAYFGPDVGWLSTPVIGRSGLSAARSGPLIVEEYDATSLVPPNGVAEVDGRGNLLIEI